MKKENYALTNKKTIEELVEELQYLNSDIVPLLRKEGEIYKNIEEINRVSKINFMNTFKIRSYIENAIEKVDKSVEDIANKIDIVPIQDKIIESMTFDTDNLHFRLNSIYKNYFETLTEVNISINDMKKHQANVEKLNNELFYMRIINIFLFIGMVILIYRI